MTDTRYRIHSEPTVLTTDTEQAALANELGYKVTAEINGEEYNQ